MMPLLFQLGPFPIRTYGVFFATAFYVANACITHFAGQRGLSKQKMTDLVFWGFLVSILGARILYILTQLPYYIAHPLEIFEYWAGGFVFFGGFIATIPFIFWYTSKHKLPLWKVYDVLTLGLVIGHAIGRIGCFATGCCYGKPTSSMLGVCFHASHVIDYNLRNVPVHPTQLYESFSLFILFFILVRIFKNARFDGQISFIYLFTYPVIRSIIECFRGDISRGFIFENIFSISQFISSLVFISGFITFMIHIRKTKLLKEPHTHAST